MIVGDVVYQAVYNQVVVASPQIRVICNIMAGKDPSADVTCRVSCTISRIVSCNGSIT